MSSQSLGGALLANRSDHPSAVWLRSVTAELKASRGAARAHAHHRVWLLRPQLPGTARARARSSAAGRRPASAPPASVEGQGAAGRAGHGRARAPLVFADNDRPGIMLASAVRTYLNRCGVARPPCRGVHQQRQRLSRRARLAARRGRRQRGRPAPRPAGRPASCRTRRGHRHPRRPCHHLDQGASAVTAVQVQRLGDAGDRVEGSIETLPCDLLCVSGGWNPTIHLHSQSRAAPRYEEERALFLPGSRFRRSARPARATARSRCARASNRVCAPDRKGRGGAGSRRSCPTCRNSTAPTRRPRASGWCLGRPMQRSKMFVDLQNDVTAGDLQLALGEGYRSIEHVKRYTTAGMGTDQGDGERQRSGHRLRDHRSGDCRHRRDAFRPPYTPVTFGAIVGRNCGAMFDPVRRNRCMTGTRRRARCSRTSGNGSGRGITRALGGHGRGGRARGRGRAQRHRHPGRLDAQGTTSSRARVPRSLDRIYTNSWSQLPVGRCRYGLMLGEDGMVFDDGVTTRLSERHYP